MTRWFCLSLAIAFAAGAQSDEERKQVIAIQEKLRASERVSPEERALLQAVNQRAREDYPKTHPARDSTGMIPLPDLGTGAYQGEPGGLYPDGKNQPPESYAKLGLAAASKIHPLDANGQPAPEGKIVMVSTGMSNTTMESQAFANLLKNTQGINPSFLFVDCAQGSQVAMITRHAEANYWKVADERLAAAGVSPRQVQVAWLKQANPLPLGDFHTEANHLKDDIAATIDVLREKYPNLRIVYLSSRIYAGYATVPLNPEPYAYEGGFAVKWLIADEIKNPHGRPWVAWGPYLWADGVKGRKQDELVYMREDVAADGTHPSAPSGRRKVAVLLMAFLRGDPSAKTWFLKP